MIFTVYRHLYLSPLKRDRLNSASMFISIIYSTLLCECQGVVFISNKASSVWFSLSAHALIKLDISCLQMERHFVDVKSACLSLMQSFKLNHELDPGDNVSTLMLSHTQPWASKATPKGNVASEAVAAGFSKTLAHSSSSADGPFFI